MNVIGVADAEASVSRLIVEQNGSDFLVRWDLHASAANVTSVVLVWCASRSSVLGCEVMLSFLAFLLLDTLLHNYITNFNMFLNFLPS